MTFLECAQHGLQIRRRSDVAYKDGNDTLWHQKFSQSAILLVQNVTHISINQNQIQAHVCCEIKGEIQFQKELMAIKTVLTPHS